MMREVEYDIDCLLNNLQIWVKMISEIPSKPSLNTGLLLLHEVGLGLLLTQNTPPEYFSLLATSWLLQWVWFCVFENSPLVVRTGRG